MKPNDYPEGFSQPGSGFFDRQLASVMARTVGLENWELPGTRNVEGVFPVPEGCWSGMEDGIRARIARPGPRFTVNVFVARLVLAPAALALVLALGFWFLKTGNETYPVNVAIGQLSADDMLDFVAESDPELVSNEVVKWMGPTDIALLSGLDGLPGGESKPARDFMEESLPYPDLEQTFPDEL
jgi:hypothetical protein